MQLDEETQDVTCCSIETLARMLHVPAAAADINKADLAGLLLRILQGPSLESFRDTAANALYFFCSQPAGRQQLLEKLTPDSAKSLIDLSLKFFEAPEYNRSALIVATGDILCSLLSCSCSVIQSLSEEELYRDSSNCSYANTPACIKVFDRVIVLMDS